MNISAFRTGFKGTRSNRFIITPGAPAGSVGTAPTVEAFKFYAKATSFPGSAIGMIPVSYQGRVVKYSGERQFAEWSIQVYDSSVSSSVNIRKYFEDWMTLGDNPATHLQKYDIASTGPWKIEFDDIASAGSGGGGGAVPSTTASTGYKKQFNLFSCWPIDISAIDLNYEAADSFAEFTLTLAYDFHQKSSSTAGTA